MSQRRTTEIDPAAGFAAVYDVVYGGSSSAGQAQLDFLIRLLGLSPRAVLDAGCGPGRQAQLLVQWGHAVVGLDVDRAMLNTARMRLSGTVGSPVLVQADLQALPFRRHFDAVICLESPLAYLPTAGALSEALIACRRVLRPGGLLVADVFDYPGTLGDRPGPPQSARFPAPWGRVEVWEAHRYDRIAGIWQMTQRFRVQREEIVETFEIQHRLYMRSVDEYASALEGARFSIQELLTAYPNTPPALRYERRMIFVACA